MARIAMALKTLNIQVKLVPDIDILNDKNVFKKVIEVFGIKWEDVNKEYQSIVSNLHSSKERIYRKEFKEAVLGVLVGSQEKELSKEEIKDIMAELRIESKWENLKKSGISALPRGDATVAFDKLNKKLKEARIFIVTVGELECFVKQVGGHGPDWTNKVLEDYPDLNDEVYNSIKKFVRELCEIE